MAEGKGRDWENKDPPAAGESQVRDPLGNLKVHRCVEPDEMHPGVLRKLEDAVTHEVQTQQDQVQGPAPASQQFQAQAQAGQRVD